MSCGPTTAGEGGQRLESLLSELELDAGPEASLDAGVDATSVVDMSALSRSGGDAFFTARVLGALPEPLGWTGASPLMRATTLLAFHVAAAVIGVIVYRWASPRALDVAASRAVEAASPWASSLSLVSIEADSAVLAAAGVVAVVGLVAFWATRSHTPAT